MDPGCRIVRLASSTKALPEGQGQCRGMNRMIVGTVAYVARATKRFYVSLPFVTNSLQDLRMSSCLAMQAGMALADPRSGKGGHEFHGRAYRIHSSALRRLCAVGAFRKQRTGGDAGARSQEHDPVPGMSRIDRVAVFPTYIQD